MPSSKELALWPESGPELMFTESSSGFRIGAFYNDKALQHPSPFWLNSLNAEGEGCGASVS